MENNEFELKLAYLEEQSNKYSCLTILTKEQIHKLKEKLKDYQKFNSFDYKGSLLIPENISEIELILKINNIDYKNIIETDITSKINELIQKEIKKLLFLKEKLGNIIDSKYILDYEIIKNNIFRGKIEHEYLNKITTNNNREIVNKLKKLYNKINIFSKNTLENNIIYEVKKIIFDIENEINSICYNLNIDYKNKTYKEKYFQIIEKIQNKLISYDKINEEIQKIYLSLTGIENNLSKEMKNIGVDLNLSFKNIMELSKLDIDKLMKEIIVYNNSKKQITNESKIIFKK